MNRENEITYGFKKEAKGIVKEFSSKREIEDGAYYKDGGLYLEGNEVCKKDDTLPFYLFDIFFIFYENTFLLSQDNFHK